MQPNFETLQTNVNGGHLLRDGALAQLSATDLAFTPGGHNPTLGMLFKQFGDLQQSYVQSLRTGQHDWSTITAASDLAHNRDQLQAWFQHLDAALLAALRAADWAVPIDRGDGVTRTVPEQIEIYTQANLIFLGKVVVYFHALQKPLPPALAHYIG